MNGPSHDVDVEVWRVPLNLPAETVEGLKPLLSDDQLARAGRYHFEGDRRRSIVRRAALRSILAASVGRPPAELQFAYGPQGKPALATTDAGFHFNLSHSGEMALVAVGRAPLGVDLERLREVADADLVARRFFTPKEVALQRAAVDANRLFLQHWTRKEAIIKAIGKGLSMPLDTFEVSERIVLTRETGGEQTWHLQDLHPADGFLAAIATAAPIEHIAWRDWVPSAAFDQ